VRLSKRDRQREKKTERSKDIKIERHKDRKTEISKDRMIQRQKDTKTEWQKDRETHFKSFFSRKKDFKDKKRDKNITKLTKTD
jgi:hypothetical protein